MSVRLLLRGGARLGAGQAVAQSCGLARNVILARLISPENFGVAAAFAMTYSLLDMMSQLAPDVQVVQAAEGEREEFQATAQAMHALRGLTVAAALLAIARPAARLFGAPQAAWAFLALAVLPLLRGLVHMDLNRAQRHLDFVPAVRAEVASNAVSLLAALPLALWRRDYSAMLFLLLLQAAVYLTVSHFGAQRRYAWRWERAAVRRILHFGWPLVVNGLLMYGIFQGDRLVIGAAPRLFGGNQYTLAGLGVYSAAVTLALAPFVFLSNSAGQLFLPWLSRAADDAEEFRRRYDACGLALAVLAAATALPMIAAAAWLVRTVYGARYAEAAMVLAGLAAMFGLRLLRVPPTLAAMAQGDTRNAMWSNLARSLALAVVALAAAVNAPLAYLPLCGVAGECVALWMSCRRLYQRQGVASEITVRVLPLYAAGLALAAGLAALGKGGGLLEALVDATGCAALTLGAMLYWLPELRSGASDLLASMAGRGEVLGQAEALVRTQEG